MSFSSETKNEITQHRPSKTCCVRAAIYGAVCFSKYYDAQGLVLQTEQQNVARYVQRALKKNGIASVIAEKGRSSGNIYELTVKEPEQLALLRQLLQHSGKETSLQISPELLCCSGCVSAFVATAFLCGGTITDPQKEYNLEFLTPRFNLSRDFEGLLAEHHFAPHRTTRKGVNVVYIKSSSNIEDLLAFMGAHNASMKIMDQKMYRSVRNQVNRLNNCETANMKKKIDANTAILKAIRYLQQENALEALSPELQQAAAMRQRMPDASLADLAAAFDPPLSKSGMSHRLKRLEALAADLQKRHAEQEGNQNNGQ